MARRLGKGICGDNPKKLRELNKEYYQPYGAINEEKELLEWVGKWIYWYNVKRLHFGEKMGGKPPLLKLRYLG